MPRTRFVKFDKTKEKAVIKLLDAAARKYGLLDVRHAANKWTTVQRVRASLAKKRAALQSELDKVNKKLR